MKVSTAEHNLANWIAEHIARAFPELAANPIPGVWFTGSKVWSMAYGLPSCSAEAVDWDIFTVDENAACRLVTGMGWNLLPAFKTNEKRLSKRPEPAVDPERHIPKLSKTIGPDGCAYSDGYCYLTDRGPVDVWVSADRDVLGELRTYPTESHAHCRVAFSFTDGLVMLPNERAQFGAKYGRAA